MSSVFRGFNFMSNMLNHRAHLCTFCSRTFSSSQALGGHQNAHRSERSMLRMLVVRDRPQSKKKRAAISRYEWLVTKPADGSMEVQSGLNAFGEVANRKPEYFQLIPFLELTLGVGASMEVGSSSSPIAAGIEGNNGGYYYKDEELDLTLRL